MPAEPTCAGIPTPIGCHPAALRCQTSIFADEPPTPTTEMTWVALPTERSNHGVVSAWPSGAVAIAMAAAAITATRRRTTHGRRLRYLTSSKGLDTMFPPISRYARGTQGELGLLRVLAGTEYPFQTSRPFCARRWTLHTRSPTSWSRRCATSCMTSAANPTFRSPIARRSKKSGRRTPTSPASAWAGEAYGIRRNVAVPKTTWAQRCTSACRTTRGGRRWPPRDDQHGADHP
jgi:hypothetical protein